MKKRHRVPNPSKARRTRTEYAKLKDNWPGREDEVVHLTVHLEFSRKEVLHRLGYTDPLPQNFTTAHANAMFARAFGEDMFGDDKIYAMISAVDNRPKQSFVPKGIEQHGTKGLPATKKASDESPSRSDT